MVGAIIPLYFPFILLIKYYDGQLSPFYFFLASSFALLRFLSFSRYFQIVPVLLSQSATVFFLSLALSGS